MFLLEPERTAYDLSFNLGGTPVRVHPFFWLMSALLGQTLLQEDNGLLLLLLWIACVFVSILLHEMGHVLVGRFFGRPGWILLYSFGGMAVGSNNLSRRWQRIAVLFAGPLAQLLLLGALRLGLWFRASQGMGPLPELVEDATGFLLQINFYWPLLNLLPIWPLDGGQISREVLEGLRPGQGTRASLGISLLVAGVLAIQALSSKLGRPLIDLPFLRSVHGTYQAVFFGLFAVTSFLALQEENQKPWRREDPWDG